MVEDKDSFLVFSSEIDVHRHENNFHFDSCSRMLVLSSTPCHQIDESCYRLLAVSNVVSASRKVICKVKIHVFVEFKMSCSRLAHYRQLS